ncbi:SET domain-containing protein 4 [Erysiphe neolycopersici]|uniref:SET domain-containing protein 4 n=1 Tax=Erysiphe neolycopersici TaxID=212602 RepID=A0A420H802_9PEZI|nr:SET domain-containing protein 4 [Erysiphe neolycopersici]
MDIHQEFTEWAQRRGLEIIDIKAQEFHGRGMGIMARKNVQAKTIILRVPYSALRTQDTVSPIILEALKGPQRISVHGLLAMDHILLNSQAITTITTTVAAAACTLAKSTNNGYDNDNYKPWHDVLPKFSEFQESMSICWPSSLQELLPPMSKALLQKQQKKLQKDWNIASKAWSSLTYNNYLYAWLLINTRTFYFIPPSKYRSGSIQSNNATGGRCSILHRDDCMALNPFSDYFNHSPSPSAAVKITNRAFEISTIRDVKANEELTISYGNHSNDFLLAEYGFFLDDNPWDEVLLDDYIFPLLNSSQKEQLECFGFLGNYVLDRNSVCHRTQVVLRILYLSLPRWESFVKGLDDGEKDQPRTDQILRDILIRFRQDIQKILEEISSLGSDFSTQKALLGKRWIQIDNLLRATLDKW